MARRYRRFRRRMGRRPMRRFRSRRIFRRTRARRIRPEKKFYDAGSSFTVSSIAGTDIAGCLVPGGSTVNARVGLRIQCRGYQVRGAISVGAVACRMRLIVFLDLRKGQGLTNLGQGDVLISSGDMTISPFNITNSPMFRVLRDRVFKLDLADHHQINFKWWIPVKHTIAYQDATNSNIVSGRLCMLFFSDQSVSANEPTFIYTTRLRYVDV